MCLCLPTQPRPCSHRAHPSSSLQMAPLDFSVPNQITSGRVSLPSHLPASSVGCTSNQPCARWWQQSGRSCSTALGCPRPFRGLKVTVGQGVLRDCCCLRPDLPPGRRSGVVRTCLELQQRVVPARKREMSSCGSSTLDPKGRAGLCSSPQSCCQPRCPGDLPQGLCPQNMAQCLTAGHGCLHPSLLP